MPNYKVATLYSVSVQGEKCEKPRETRKGHKIIL